MGTMMKVSAAILVAAASVYVVVRMTMPEPAGIALAEPRLADVELLTPIDAASVAEDLAREVPQRSPLADEPPRALEEETQLVPWPDVTLAVRDARTRAHLQDVEIRCASSAMMGAWHRPAIDRYYIPVGERLRSPMTLRGRHEADDPKSRVARLGFAPDPGQAPQFVELRPDWRMGSDSVLIYARATGYAWQKVRVDVSSGNEFEILLNPETVLNVKFANVQLERYAALEAKAEFGVHRVYPNGNLSDVWFQAIDETLAAEGLRLDGLKPGDYSVFVRLGERWSSRKQPMLASEMVSLAVGEPRELVLHLDDPPLKKRESATLAGVVSFPPMDGGYEWVRLDLFEVMNSPISMLSLADMERTDHTPHTWSFRVEDVPEGLYQFLLRPFMVSWMVELPPGGREDLELVIPELAEVLVETVDAHTGERIPLESITYGLRALHPHQIQTYQQSGVSFEGEPGLFRFATAPGAAFIQTYKMPSGQEYGWRRMDLELIPGRQSVRLELGPRYAIRFQYLENGKAPRSGDDLHWGAMPRVRAVDHGGQVTHEGSTGDRIMELSAPGIYEIRFEDVTGSLFQPIPARQVSVRAGETTLVTVELQRK